jgi:hypothetical protein
MSPLARRLLSPRDMRLSPLPSLDAFELRHVVGGAARETRRANVAMAMQSLKNNGNVAGWVSKTQAAKHGMIDCVCGCGLPNCR